MCHGAAGDGKGFIVTEGKYTAAPPSYFDPLIMALPEGKMFHSVTYGKMQCSRMHIVFPKKNVGK